MQLLHISLQGTRLKVAVCDCRKEHLTAKAEKLRSGGAEFFYSIDKDNQIVRLRLETKQ
jgi:hypothetical protein